MKLTKKQTIDYAVEVVDYLNRVIMGLELNGIVCLPADRKTDIRDCFLARAKDLVMGATRELLEAAYYEVAKDGLKDDPKDTLERMFKHIANRAPNPDNEKSVETVWFGIV